MRIMITGCSGFIGSNLTKECINRGWEVDGVDDMSNGHIEFIPPGIKRLYICDFADDSVINAIEAHAYDAVIHLAAIPRVSYSVEHPVETNDVNVSRTLKLMESCRGNTNRFVFASSSSVYGGASVLPTPESHPKDPKSPYALQKSVIEDYLKMYSDLYGLDSIALRFFNVFGPNQLGDSPYSTAVSAWLTAIKQGKPMRSDGDGEQSRDMCYVDNVVDACCRAAVSKHHHHHRANVACGDRTTNNDILQFLLKRYPDAKYITAPVRPGDVLHTQADVSYGDVLLGYKPIVKFWEGLEKTVQWTEENWDTIKMMKLRT